MTDLLAESIKTQQRSEKQISIYLEESKYHKDLYEVQDIQVSIEGLEEIDFPDICSWIQKDELEGLKNKSRNIKFICGGFKW